MAAKVVSSWRTLENVDAECTHCGVRMRLTVGEGKAVRYFHCTSCRRTLSSTYTDVLRADAKMRTHPVRPPEERKQLETVKSRLERFLAAVDDQDPYRLLGVSPRDSLEHIRTRYRELALESHPDRGGTAERMRELNLAYERIVEHHERRSRAALPVGLRTGMLPAV